MFEVFVVVWATIGMITAVAHLMFCWAYGRRWRDYILSACLILLGGPISAILMVWAWVAADYGDS